MALDDLTPDDDQPVKPIKPRMPLADSQRPMEIPGPNMAGVKTAVNLPGVQIPQNPQLAKDQATQVQLNKGSGVQQLSKSHPVIGGVAKVADVLGSILAPGFSSMIPGTTLHHNALVNRNTNALNTDVEQQQKTALAEQETAKAKELANPQPKPTEEEWTVTPDGLHKVEKHSGQVVPLDDAAGKGVTDPKAGYAQAIADAIKNNRDPNTDPHVQAWKTAIENLAKGEPLKTEKTVRVIGGVPHEVLVNAQTGEDIKDLGQTKVPGESPADKRSATESAQVEREARQNIRKAEGEYRNTQKSVSQLMSSIDAAKDGNGLLTSFVPTMEVLGINAANGVHRISPAEAQAANLPGGFAEQFNAWFDKASSGKISPQLQSEGKQLAKILLNSSYQRYKSTYDDEGNIVSGYGGKDFNKRVPLIPGEEQQAVSEPSRPANVPAGYVFQDGPKGKGWYKPSAGQQK